MNGMCIYIHVYVYAQVQDYTYIRVHVCVLHGGGERLKTSH